MTEGKVKSTFSSIKRFYSELVWFSLGNLLFVSIWFAYDRQCVFWPKYVMFVWGISLVVTAYRQGIVEHYIAKLLSESQMKENKKTETAHKQKRVPLYKYWQNR